MTEEVYQKLCTQAKNSQLVFDPMSGQFVSLVQEPESLTETSSDSGSICLSESASDSVEPGLASEPESLADSDNLALARRYRLAALTITNPQVRKQYLDKADSLASESNGDSASENVSIVSGFEPESNGDSAKPGLVELPYSVKIHSGLAQKIIADKEHTRTFALWSVLRSFGSPGHFAIADVLDIAGQTGKAMSTLYGWLQKGDSIFWKIESGRVYLIGHYKVFSYFLGENVRPGKIVYVPVKHVLDSKLHVVRSHLSSTFVSGDNGKILSRETREALYRVPRRTQQTYDQTSSIKVKPIFARAKPKNIQLSNWYGRPVGYTTRHPGRASKRHFFGYRATDNRAMVTHSDSEMVANGSVKNGGYRRYFNDQVKAVEVAEYRKENDIAIPVFWVNPETSPNKPIMTTWLW